MLSVFIHFLEKLLESIKIFIVAEKPLCTLYIKNVWIIERWRLKYANRDLDNG